jgi:hypothetical protein
MINRRGFRWDMGLKTERKMSIDLWWETPMEREHLEDQDLNAIMLLK